MSSNFRVYKGAADWRAGDFGDAGWIDLLTREQKYELEMAARALPTLARNPTLWPIRTQQSLTVTIACLTMPPTGQTLSQEL